MKSKTKYINLDFLEDLSEDFISKLKYLNSKDNISN